MTPRPFPLNHLRLEEPDHRFGEGVIVGIPAAADGRVDAGVGQAFGVAHRQVLRAAITVVNQIADPVAAAGVDRLLERIEHEIGAQRRRHASADNAAGKDVDDERDVDEAAPRRDIREGKTHSWLGRIALHRPFHFRSGESRGCHCGGFGAQDQSAHLWCVLFLDGSFPIAKPPDADFVERAWEAIADGMPEKAQAPSRLQPTGAVTRDEALALLAASRDKLIAAARALDPERALLTIDPPLVGCISLYQVGEWAAVHVIRHNKQMKRLLSS
jgi:hypothetical protein